MWGDEGWSIWLARGDTPRDLTLTMVADHHGPVYSLLLRGWGLLAGETVLALRWITVMFSIASIALIYALGRALFSPAGVGAALAFALMDKQVVLTQEVRDYPMIFLAMIAIALYYVRWRRNPRGGNAFWFVAWSVCGLYLHYYCYMVNLAILVHAGLTLRERTARRHFLALNGADRAGLSSWRPSSSTSSSARRWTAQVLNIHGMPLNRHTIEYLASRSFGQPVALYALLMVVGAWGRCPTACRVTGPPPARPAAVRGIAGGAVARRADPDHLRAHALPAAHRPQHLGDHAGDCAAGRRQPDGVRERFGVPFSRR